jgi:hypothetical protein
MQFRPHSIARVSAVIGMTMLFGQPWPLLAQTGGGAPSTPSQTQTPPSPAANLPPARDAETKAETVELRIATLHTSLQITQAQEARWTRVAKAMRENAAILDKHASERMNRDKAGMTALDNLHTYQHYAEAHVTGLKHLTKAFEELYESMPPAQRKNADQVFQAFGRDMPETHT